MKRQKLWSKWRGGGGILFFIPFTLALLLLSCGGDEPAHIDVSMQQTRTSADSTASGGQTVSDTLQVDTAWADVINVDF